MPTHRLSDCPPVADPSPVRLPACCRPLACPTTCLLPTPRLPDYRLPSLAGCYSLYLNKSHCLFIPSLPSCVQRLGPLVLYHNSTNWPNMDPADTEAVRRAISYLQTQLGQHDQALQEITSSLRELFLTITSRLHFTPEPPAPVPSHSASPREPFIPERCNGDLGLCRSFLLQCSLVFELQPLTYPTDKARIAYLIGTLRGEALPWATAVCERSSAACSDYSAFTEEMRRVFNHPVRGREASQRLLLLGQGSRSVSLIRGRVSDSCGRERVERGSSAGGFLERAGE